MCRALLVVESDPPPAHDIDLVDWSIGFVRLHPPQRRPYFVSNSST